MQKNGLSVDSRNAVEEHVTEWLSDQRIPGAAVAVVDGDEAVYAEGFGARHLEDNTPATADTLFGIGSCTKSFTAAAVMRLVEDGAVSLDDRMNDYLPHLAEAPGEPVTVEELLTHTSGLPSDGSAGPLITRPLGLGHVEVPLSGDGDFRRHVEGSVDRRVTDRETFFYYNSGYTMLGQLIERVSDRPFAVYVETEILAPLGMERSTFDRETFESDDDRMTPYVKQDGSSTSSGFPFDEFIQAPGGLVSSVREMADYLQLYMNDGAVDGEQVLSSESVAAMTTPEGTFGTYLDGRDVGYGYGLMTEEYLGDRLVGHGGSVAVSNAWFGYLEAADLGVVLACTTGPETHPTDVGKALLALLNGKEPAEVEPHYRLLHALERVTGEYEGYRDIVSGSVERVGGSLRFEKRSGIGTQEILLTPERVEDDRLVCTTVESSGMEREVRFEFAENDGGHGAVDLFHERTRLTKID